MLPPFTVEEVRRLLAEDKFSQRKIARLTGVSRGTVAAIASGKRPDYEYLPGVDREAPLRPPARCPSCGGKVYLPCRLCNIRDRQTAVAGAAARDCPDFRGREKGTVPLAALPRDTELEPLGLELKPEHRRRYEEVRMRLDGKMVSAFGD